MLVHFEMCVETSFGDTAMVVGSVSPLGSWNPACGLRMSTDESCYPVWQGSQHLDCDDSSPIEYKIVILRASGDVEWEPLTLNRRLPCKGQEVQNSRV